MLVIENKRKPIFKRTYKYRKTNLYIQLIDKNIYKQKQTKYKKKFFSIKHRQIAKRDIQKYLDLHYETLKEIENKIENSKAIKS